MNFEQILEIGIFLYEDSAESSGQEGDMETFDYMMKEVEKLKVLQVKLKDFNLSRVNSLFTFEVTPELKEYVTLISKCMQLVLFEKKREIEDINEEMKFIRKFI